MRSATRVITASSNPVGSPAQPEDDVTNPGSFCFVTANGAVGGKPKMPRYRRLHARAVENLALDRRAVHDLLRDHLDRQKLLRLPIKMVKSADDDARASEEARLHVREPGRVVVEVGPVRELPVPTHDR